MRIGSKSQFEVPDKCPEDCLFRIDYFDQWCIRCPIFNTKKVLDEEGNTFSLLRPEEFRDDWAAEWEQCFKTGKTPELCLMRGGEGEMKMTKPPKHRRNQPDRRCETPIKIQIDPKFGNDRRVLKERRKGKVER